jgi:hypothetical protein
MEGAPFGAWALAWDTTVTCNYILMCAHFRSGELAAEYEDKKKSMQQAQEETNFSYHKKRVHSIFNSY